MKKFRRTILAAMAAAALTTAAAVPFGAAAEVVPNPVISRGCPAYSGVNPATVVSGNDEHYFSFAFLTAPDYLAYDLSEVPEKERKQIIAVWYNTST